MNWAGLERYAVHKTECILERRKFINLGTQVTAVMAGLEDLRGGQRRRFDAIVERDLTIAKNPWLLWLPRSVVDAIFDERLDVYLSAARVCAGVGLCFPMTRRPRSLFESIQVLITLHEALRYAGIGRDGSDHALLVSQLGLLVNSLASREGPPSVRGLHFIGAQGILAYFSSGYVKLTSPIWRHGIALSGTLRPVSYGDHRIYLLLTKFPALRRVLAWSIIGMECFYPLMLFLPRRWALAWSSALMIMHTAIAYFMGLNRFLPAFVAMHPATLGLRADLRSFRRDR